MEKLWIGIGDEGGVGGKRAEPHFTALPKTSEQAISTAWKMYNKWSPESHVLLLSKNTEVTTKLASDQLTI